MLIKVIFYPDVSESQIDNFLKEVNPDRYVFRIEGIILDVDSKLLSLIKSKNIVKWATSTCIDWADYRNLHKC